MAASEVSCEVCRRLPADATTPIRYPLPVVGDEWVANDRIRGAFIGAALGNGLGAPGSGATGQMPLPATLVTGGTTQLGLFTSYFKAMADMYPFEHDPAGTVRTEGYT